MKDLGEAEDMIPNTMGWIMQNQHEEDLLADHTDMPQIQRYAIAGSFTPFSLQINYTDTLLSHRFVRFEIPHNGNYDEIKGHVQAFLEDLTHNKETNGIVLTRLQEDKDLLSEGEVISRGAMAKTGNRIMTVNMVCNLALDTDKYKPFMYQTHVKGNFDFIDDLHSSLKSF
jgi:hypothetical protein